MSVSDDHIAQAAQERQAALFLPGSDVTIWRYMDFTKFASLLEERALFFSRADKFADPFEGSYTEANRAARSALLSPPPPDAPTQAEADSHTAAKQMLESTFSEFFEAQKQHVFVNCWHMNEHESAAMWKLYAKSDEAIAIRSTYSRLRECLPVNQAASGQPLDGHVDIGCVRYIDYTTEAVKGTYTFSPFLHKRKSYEHERELRAFFQIQLTPESGRFQWHVMPADRSSLEIHEDPRNREPYVQPPPEEPGRLVPIELDRLIEAVHVAPQTQAWYRDLVTSLLERHSLHKPVYNSLLEGRPVF